MAWLSSFTLLLLLTAACGIRSTRVDSRDVQAAIDRRSLEETSDTAAKVHHVIPDEGSTIWFGPNKSAAKTAPGAPKKNGIGPLDVEDGDDLGAMAQMDININILDTVTRLSGTTASIFQLLTVLEAASLGSAASVIGLPIALLGGIVSAWATYKDVQAAKLCMLQNFIEGLGEMLMLVSKKRAGVADALMQLRMDIQMEGSSASSRRAETASLEQDVDALADWAQRTIQQLCEDPDWAHLQGVVVNIPNFFVIAEDPVQYTTLPCEAGASEDSSHSKVAEAMGSSRSSWKEVITQSGSDEIRLLRMTQYYTEVIRAVNDVMVQFSERLREDGKPWHYDKESARMARKHMLANSVLGLLTLGPDLFTDVKAAASVGSHLVALGTHGVSGGLKTKEALGWAQEDKVARLLQVKGVLLELGIDIETDEGRELLDAKVEDVLELLKQKDEKTQSISLHVQTWWLENKILSHVLQPIAAMSHYHVEHKLAFNVLVVPTLVQAIHDEAVFTAVATHSSTPELEPWAGLEMFCADPTSKACKKHRTWTVETSNQSTVTAWLFGSTLRTSSDGRVNIRPGDVRIVIVDSTTLKLDAAGLPCTNYLNLGFPILHERMEFDDGWQMCMGLSALVTAGLHIDQDSSDMHVLEYYIDQFARGTGCTDEMKNTKKQWRK